MSKARIAVGCDHAGFEYKEEVKKMLTGMGYLVKDYGTHSKDSVDYPDFVHPVAESIEDKDNELGVLFCGSANGVAITANKHQQIRAAIAWEDEIASLARQHNDANVLCLPARFISLDDAKKFTLTFLTTSFEGGRHASRVKKIAL
jgi:ribose 5-phosphate isomerase B